MGDIIPKLDEIVDRVAVYTKVGRVDNAAGPTPPPAAVPPDVVRDLTRRLEALEKAVFKGGAGGTAPNTAAQGPTPPPES